MDNARIHHGEGILELAERFREQFFVFFKCTHSLSPNRDSHRIFATILT